MWLNVTANIGHQAVVLQVHLDHDGAVDSVIRTDGEDDDGQDLLELGTAALDAELRLF